MMYKMIFCAFCCFFSTLKGYHVTPEIWEAVDPYLIPEDHPMKAELDKLFSSGRPTKTKKSLLKAKFSVVGRGSSKLDVVTHKKLRGYALKLYRDELAGYCDWHQFVKRAEGARVIGKIIEEMGYSRKFKVSKKWIYPLPQSDEDAPYHFLLVVENLFPIRGDDNLKKYRTHLKHETVERLYHFIETTGYIDCVPWNLRYCIDGKIGVLDTEHWFAWPIEWSRLRNYLSPENQYYLDNLIG